MSSNYSHLLSLRYGPRIEGLGRLGADYKFTSFPTGTDAHVLTYWLSRNVKTAEAYPPKILRVWRSFYAGELGGY